MVFDMYLSPAPLLTFDPFWLSEGNLEVVGTRANKD
jgi:hypothetical protein